MATAPYAEHEAPPGEAPADPFGRTWADMVEMVDLRRKLAEAELASDLAAGKRLGIAGSLGAILALTGLPLLVAALAYLLADVTGLNFATWLLIFGGPLVMLGLAVVYFSWRRFRRKFLALSATRQELREDLLWLREWLANSGE